jgi:hypothetical protein
MVFVMKKILFLLFALSALPAVANDFALYAEVDGNQVQRLNIGEDFRPKIATFNGSDFNGATVNVYVESKCELSSIMGTSVQPQFNCKWFQYWIGDDGKISGFGVDANAKNKDISVPVDICDGTRIWTDRDVAKVKVISGAGDCFAE